MMHYMAENMGQAPNKKNTDLSHPILTDTSNYSGLTSSSGSVSSDGSDIPIKNRRNLYVANLDNDITEPQLRMKFVRFGQIISVHIITNRADLPGCGFVNYSTHEEAQKAVDTLNGTIWNGKKIKVDFALKKTTGGKSGATTADPNNPSLVKPAPPTVGSKIPPAPINNPWLVGNSSLNGIKIGENGQSSNLGKTSQEKLLQQSSLKTNSNLDNQLLNGSKISQNLVKTDSKSASSVKTQPNNNISLPLNKSLPNKTVGASLTGQQQSKTNNMPFNNGQGQFSVKTITSANGDADSINKTPKDFGTPLNLTLKNPAANGMISTNSNKIRSIKMDKKEIEAKYESEEVEDEDDSESGSDNDIDTEANIKEKKDNSIRKNIKNQSQDNNYNDTNIETILTQLDNAIRNVFEKGKVRQINQLRSKMQMELSNNFSEPESYRIVDYLLDKVEETITTFVKLDGHELLRNPVDQLKESLKDWYGRDNAIIMKLIEQIRRNLKLFAGEENKKAILVTQMILTETYLEKFLNTGSHIQVGLLEKGVRKIENAKIFFKTESMRSERQQRLDLIKDNLKSLTVHDDSAKRLIKTVYEELKEVVKNAYVGFPMRSKLGKKVPTFLMKLRSELAGFATEAEIKLQITYELNLMETEIVKHNRDGLRKFLDEHQTVLKEQLSTKGRFDDEIFDPEFWKDIEKYLLESCLEGTPTSAKDAAGGVNLYVNNLHPQLDSARLEREFSRFGTIISARVFPQSKKLYGTAVVSSGPNTKLYGFVKYASPASAVKAMDEMNGEHIMGREVEVSVATNTENLKTYFKYLLGRTM